MIKKYHNGAWETVPYKRYETSTDTLTTLPAEVIADGNNATVGLVGNMSQSGTPTSQNPIQPSECGERTGNLFDKNSDTINNTGVSRPGVNVPAGVYSINNGTDRAVYYRVGYNGTASQINAGRSVENISANDRLYVWRDNNIRQDGVMLNTGSTALPYEPYGFKIPISSANTTTPVYLGEVQTTREIIKYEFTGQENWSLQSYGTGIFACGLPNYLHQVKNITICSHYKTQNNVDGVAGIANKTVCFYYSSAYPSASSFYAHDTSYTTLDAWKQYLTAQYAAGTPVTVWYVLATPTTGIVNEPIRKIGEYADTISNVAEIPTTAGEQTFDVDTTLKPSSVEITYKGWHKHTPKEYDNGSWS